jgi:hypothetical protein
MQCCSVGAHPDGARIEAKGSRLEVRGLRLEAKGERLEVRGQRLRSRRQNRCCGHTVLRCCSQEDGAAVMQCCG